MKKTIDGESKSRVERFVAMTLHRPVTMLMLLMSTVLIGVIAQTNLRLELLPTGFVNTQISISIPVPNANPIEVEEQVTKPTYEVLRQISGLATVNTNSSKNRSFIGIEFARGVDPNEAFAEVRDLMEVAKLRWPDDVQEYTTSRFNLDNDIPILQFGVLLEEWESDTSFIIDEKITKEIESIDGVAQVEPWGIVEETIRIFVDKEQAAAAEVSLFELSQSLAADNRDVIGGRITDGDQQFYLRSVGRFRDLDELRNYPIRPDLRLKDVAEVTSAKALRNFVFRLNGKRAVWFSVSKESTANTVDVCERIRDKIANKISKDRRMAEKGWEFFPSSQGDLGRLVTDSLDGLLTSALIGGLLAIIPLFCFLRRVRLTFIIALAIPTSLLIALGCVYFTGGTLNLLSMMGFTISIGMLVDNAIVVVENIVRHREKGVGAWQGALRGTSEVALAITLATLTTVAAFVPLVFLSGSETLTWFAKAISMPVCYAVLASLLVALFFIPLATVVLYMDGRESRLRRVFAFLCWPFLRVADGIEHGLQRLIQLHQLSLGWCLRNRFAALVLIASVCGGITALASSTVKMGDFGDESGGRVRVELEFDSNFTLTDANKILNQLYAEIDERKEEFKVDYVFHWFNRRRGSLNIGLLDTSPEHTEMVVKAIDKELPKMSGVKWTVGVESQNEDKTSIKIQVFGPEVGGLAGIGDEIIERLESHPDITAVRGGIERENDELIIRPDRERMQLMGVDPRTLMGTVQYGIRGQRLPDFQAGDQKIPVIIEFDDAATTSRADLEGMQVWSRNGTQNPLSNFATIETKRGYGTIRRTNGQSSIQLTVNSFGKTKEEVATAIRDRMEGFSLPEGYSFTETSGDEFQQQMGQILLTLLLSAILILLLMGILFESVMLPPAVFATIPFAGMGALWCLAATGTVLDVAGLIGAIVLIGIVVNNGIVFLDYAHVQYQSGMSRTEALLAAGRTRLRPILMTTSTTVIGLLPMALSEASGSFVSYKALARGVMGGLTLSTIATLIVIPIVYSLLDDSRIVFFEFLSGRRRETQPQVRAGATVLSRAEEC
ncbi:MAG: efflux RND transporter permease subunit [Planctomycetota bacterium]